MKIPDECRPMYLTSDTMPDTTYAEDENALKEKINPGTVEQYNFCEGELHVSLIVGQQNKIMYNIDCSIQTKSSGDITR